MTDHPIRHHFEVDLEIAGTPETIWEAISTAPGISAWMMPAEIDARPGGRVVFHMGPDDDSTGEVTAVEPNRRLAYQEDWAALFGRPDADVTPLVTEFLIEARSGGTCSVRITSSAFGTGADWEHEFFSDMEVGWAPMLDNLRLYVELYPGRHATNMWLTTPITVAAEQAIDAVRERLGVAVGGSTTVRDVEGVLERSSPRHLLVRATSPIEGFLSFFAWTDGNGGSLTLTGQLFGAADGYVETEQTGWQGWIDEVAASLAGATP